jgi:hypothetical protein
VPSSSSRGIFVSYRPEDVLPFARILKHQLRERIPDAPVSSHMEVFIRGGEDFLANIRRAVGACAALVALIGPRWATAAGQKGPLLDDPDDSVRLAIQTALERGVRVIPVLVGGASMPEQQELPSELHELAMLVAFALGSDQYEYEADRLIDVIQQVLREERFRGARARESRSVFISYRRELSEWLALLVRGDLRKHDFDAFVDNENLDSGVFERKILSEIEAREHFIVLLEPGSLDRIDNDRDWLRREIAHALTHDRNVVPVTAKGFEFSHDLVLPPDVVGLKDFNSVAIPPRYFDAAMDRLRTRFLKLPSNP